MISVIIRYYIQLSPYEVNQHFQHAFKTVVLLVGFRNRSSSATSWSVEVIASRRELYLLEVEKFLKWKETNIGDTPIFHHFATTMILEERGDVQYLLFFKLLHDFLLLDMFPFVYLPTKQPINQWVYLGDLREQPHQGWSRTLRMCRR